MLYEERGYYPHIVVQIILHPLAYTYVSGMSPLPSVHPSSGHHIVLAMFVTVVKKIITSINTSHFLTQNPSI